MSCNAVVIAVDGPSASGKSTISRMVAERLGFLYVDSGAMYRAVTWKALQEGVDVTDSKQVVALLNRIRVEFEVHGGEVRMLVDGVYAGDAIRRPEVTEKVSIVAAIPEVRRALVAHQRSLTRFGNLVMEGRDIGSVVFPDTPHKFYVEVGVAERARRRQRDFAAMQVATTEEKVVEVTAEAMAQAPLTAQVRSVGYVTMPHRNTDTPDEECDGVG
ncbi:MAG: (d)CMP kinase, partial [Verrucomicrobiae bacterium]|nr:(d)CMP kinase [Verrucomicrobiae bacterium]